MVIARVIANTFPIRLCHEPRQLAPSRHCQSDCVDTCPPYHGILRRVKWLGQNPDGSLSAEIILIIAGDDKREKMIKIKQQRQDSVRT